MISLERTTDWELIRQIVTHSSIYPQVTDDHAAPPESWQPARSDDIWYVLVKDGTEVLGLWMLHPSSASRACWEVHTCLLPNARGKRAREAVNVLIPWTWNSIRDCMRVMTQIPTYNRAAMLFALQAGMEQFGVNHKAYLKNEKLYDLILLGISRPGVN